MLMQTSKSLCDLCVLSPMLHLHDQKFWKWEYCKILQFKITVFYLNVLKCNLFYEENFSALLIQSSDSRDPSEIILIGLIQCWRNIYINVEAAYYQYFVETIFFSEFLN